MNDFYIISIACVHPQKNSAETPFLLITCYRNQTNTQDQIQFHSLLYVFSLRDYIFMNTNVVLL